VSATPLTTGRTKEALQKVLQQYIEAFATFVVKHIHIGGAEDAPGRS